MKAKANEPVLHTQGYDGNPWDEWDRLTCIATDTKRMFGARINDYVLSCRGVELARRTETLSRGKVTAVYFMFTGAL